MKANNIILPIVTLLILPFVDTAVSKMVNYEAFGGQMLPFPEALGLVLAWLIPGVELPAALLLIAKPLRFAGRCLLIYDRVPCSCGSILKRLSGAGPLVVNTVFCCCP